MKEITGDLVDGITGTLIYRYINDAIETLNRKFVSDNFLPK